MKNKNKLGFLSAALTTAFIAGCGDGVTNADRSFSDDRDYYVPYIPGVSQASNAVFNSDTINIGGISYLDCEKLNPDAVYLTLLLEGNWVIAEANNPSNYCLATNGSAGFVSGDGKMFHFIPSSSGALLAQMKQDTFNDDDTEQYPELEIALSNDTLLDPQEEAGSEFLGPVLVVPHPTDPEKSLYRVETGLGGFITQDGGGQWFQPSTGYISFCSGCFPVAVLENGKFLMATTEKKSFKDLYPNALLTPYSNLSIYSESGDFESWVTPLGALTVDVAFTPGRHYARGVWLAGYGEVGENVIRYSYFSGSGDAGVEETMGKLPVHPTHDNSSAAFDGAGNLWVLDKSSAATAIYKHSLGGRVTSVSDFQGSLDASGLQASNRSTLLTGGN